MANLMRVLPKGKAYEKVQESEFIKIIGRLDIEAARRHLADSPSSVHEVDAAGNNAMHLCVINGWSILAPEMMSFLLNETAVSLLMKNRWKLTPLDVAFSLNDRAAVDAMIQNWRRQVEEHFAAQSHPRLRLIQGTRGSEDEPEPE